MNKAGIYIHIPFCRTKCIYCDFYSITKRDESIPHFVDCLIKEINLYKLMIQPKFKYDTIFFGGGTPSLLEPKQLELILDTLHQNFNIDENSEISLECNPGEIDYTKLCAFRSMGLNRLSIGFQSFNNNLLKFLGHLHNVDQSIATFHDARKAKIENINIDLIYNIPKQRLRDWKEDLYLVASLEPQHISAYSLIVEKNTALYSMVKNKDIYMPTERIDKEMFLNTIEQLEKSGYLQYEISNFSKANMQCRHNLHYWRLEPYLAFGPAAHGFDGQKRWWNTRSLDNYMELLDKDELPIDSNEILTQKDYFNESIMNGLRLNEGIEIKKLKEIYPDDIDNYLEPHMKKWPQINIKDKILKLKDDGILFSDKIISELFLN